MRKIQKGTSTKAASFSKSSVSFDITPILDQSPLYLNIEILLHEKDRYNEKKKKKKSKKIEESIPSIDESQPKHGHNRASKNWVRDFQWENGRFLLGPRFIRQISLLGH
jgi:hypothetical protein